VQTGLNLGAIQQSIVFAACDIREACQIGDDRPRAIVAIQAQDGTSFGKTMDLDVALDRCHCATQFCSVLSIAGVAKAGEPLMRVRVEDRGARTHDFPPFAPRVAGGTQGTQASLRRWPISCLR
jgi:hypothetical protein